MEDKSVANAQAKLITRSKAKTSIDHRKIVNYLEKISKDESGAPVKWKFSKKGVKYAKGISKHITKGPVGKKVKRLQGRPMRTDSRDARNEDKAENPPVVKRKGRKKKTVEATETDTKVEATDDNDDGGLQTDNLIISIRRVGSESANHGTTERIVTIHPVDNVAAPEETTSRGITDTTSEIAPKKKRGRPKSIHKIIQEKVKASRLKLSSTRNDESSTGEPKKKKCEALRNLEKVVAAKRGRPRKKVLENTEKSSKREEKPDSREQSVSRFDSDIESIDSNISGSSSRQKSKIRKTYQGIRLGPRKLLRSQDNLITRRKKGTLSSITAPKIKRKRTLSSDFELLDEVSLKRKIRREELDDISRESSIDRDDGRSRSVPKEEHIILPKTSTDAKTEKDESSKQHETPFRKEVVDKTLTKENTEHVQKKTNGSRTMGPKCKRRGRPPKNSNIVKEEYGGNAKMEADKQTLLKKHSLIERRIPKLSKIEKEDDLRSANLSLKNPSFIEIASDESAATFTNTRSVFTFGTLKIIGPGGVKLKGNSPLKQVIDSSNENSSMINEKPDEKEKLVCVDMKEVTSTETSEQEIVLVNKKSVIEDNVANRDKLHDAEKPIIPTENNDESKIEKKVSKTADSFASEIDTDESKQASGLKEDSDLLIEQVSENHKDLDVDASNSAAELNATEDNMLMKTNDVLTDEKSNVEEEDGTLNDFPMDEDHSTTSTVGISSEINVSESESQPSSTQMSADDNSSVGKGTVKNDVQAESRFEEEKVMNTDVHSSVSENIDAKTSSTDNTEIEDELTSKDTDKSLIEQLIPPEDNIKRQVESTSKNQVSENNFNDTTNNQEKQANETVEKKETLKVVGSENDAENVEQKVANKAFQNTIHEENENESKDHTEMIEYAEIVKEPHTPTVKEDKKMSENENNESDVSRTNDRTTVCLTESKRSESEASKTEDEKTVCLETSETPLDDTEIPGHYFRNIGKESVFSDQVQNLLQKQETEISDKINIDSSLDDKPDKNIEKDENSSSSDLSLNNSGSFTSLKDDYSKVTEESNPEQCEKSWKRKGNKKVSPTQRVFQLRQKASRSPLEIIAMRQSKEEREYLLEQSQKAFKREEKQRRMRTKQQRLEHNFDQGNPVDADLKDASDTDEKMTACGQADFSVEENTPSNDADKHTNIEDLEHQCKPCKVILIDFMRYLNVTEKLDPDTDDLQGEKSPAPEDIACQSLETTTEEKELKDEETKEIAKETETKKKRRPSARKQATGYHFNRKLTAEIVRYPEDERTLQSDFVVPPLRLKIKQNLIYEPKKKLKPGRPAKRKARKSMSPRKRANNASYRPIFSSESQTIQKNTDSTQIGLQSSGDVNDSDMCECIYYQCGFQSDRKNIEKHIYIHLKGTKMTCLKCRMTFKNSSTAYAHSGKEHPNEEVMIEPAEKCDIKQYYKVHLPAVTSATNQIIPQVEQSSEGVIIKVVLPGNRHGKGCYCCSYCDFSSSLQQDILDHINENHRPDIQYTCSICDKRFIGNKDGIAEHFKTEHPNDPISYKSMPDYYDASKGVEQSLTLGSGDKGNIFEKFSDMFPRDKQNSERFSKADRTRWLEKTSAEADSTTAEHDDLHKGSNESQKESKESEMPTRANDLEPVEDGIEALAKEYGRETTEDGIGNEDQTKGDKSAGTDIEESNDMGLKIVDVVSLRDQSNIDWPETPPSLPLSQTITGSFPFAQMQPLNHQSLAQNNVSIVSALSTPRQYPHNFTQNLQQRHGLSPQAVLPQRNQTPSSQSSVARKKNDGKTCTTYKCEKCNVHAPVLATMVEHLRLSHKDIEKLFLCPYCRQYEGATEPDIHRHIKQFHNQTMQQKSPPVALSSAAKQHLRTIQVALGDGHTSTEKVVMEKDIYKCLKCNGHMPSLDFIYSHLEKQHNEFFVNACPECKRFRHKDEQVVFQHIRDVHGKSTENVTLSVAIEENLFTRVQCLTKGKVVPSRLQTTSVPVQSSNVSKTNSLPSDYFQNQFPQYSVGRSNIPPVSFIRSSVPASASVVSTPQQTPFPSKSSLRKSRPVHRDSPRLYTPRVDADNNQPGPVNATEPPALMRGPPPLIRFQQTQFGKSLHPSLDIRSHSPQGDASVRGTSFAMTDRLQRLHSPNSSRMGSPLPPAASSPPITSRPVLKIPNVRHSLSSTISSPPPPYSVAVNARGHTANVLDLSRQIANPGIRSTSKTTPEGEDVSPDAFQIFNIRPGTPQSDPNINKYNQFQVRPTSALNPRMLVGMQSSPRMQALNQQLQTVKGIIPQRQFLPRQGFASPNVVVGDNNLPIEGRIFKCPYCPQIIPLLISEVAGHIEQKHPGSSIVFHRI